MSDSPGIRCQPPNVSVSAGDALRGLPLTAAHLKSGGALLMAFVIESWEMLIIIYAGRSIGLEFPMTPVQFGSLVGAMFIGMMLGAPLWGPIADRIGRKASMMVSLIAYSLVTLVSTLASSFRILYLSRVVAGALAVGMLVTTFPLFEELLPDRYRGRCTVYLAMGAPLGMLLALGVSIALEPFGWRWIIGASALAGFWAILIWRWVPESPRWLAAMGREGAAMEVIQYLGGGEVILDPPAHLGCDVAPRATTFAIFRGPLLKVTLLQLAVNFLLSWSFWGLQSWLPTLLLRRGLSVPESHGFLFFSIVSMIPGYVLAAHLTGRFGRKKVMMSFIGISALAGLGFALTPSLPGFYICTCILSCFSLGAWGVWDTWLAELYPTLTRSTGYGWGIVAQRLANSMAPPLMGIFIARSTSFGASALFINAFLVGTMAVSLFLVETEGTELA